MNKQPIATQQIVSLLDHIEKHLEHPLQVETLAELSCWSRWQLQRVFSHYTDKGLAQYVRQRKLSHAATQLVTGKQRIIDIAFDTGFNSENAFSRAFKQHFSLSPRAYRQRGKLVNLTYPLLPRDKVLPAPKLAQFDDTFLELTVTTRDAFHLQGIHTPIYGLLAQNPDFDVQVPKLWQAWRATHGDTPLPSHCMGVIDVTHHCDNGLLTYWAGLPEDDARPSPDTSEQRLFIPEQTYVVATHKGELSQLPNLVFWLLTHWLPQSGFQGVDGYELEVYPIAAPTVSPHYVEYWLPISC